MTTATEVGPHRALRHVLSRFATGVTVITTLHEGRRVGLTVNSFTSLSLEPPLVLWCLRRQSATHPAFAAAEYFAVNVLAADQRNLAERFAGRSERFTGVALHAGRYGLPLLDGTVGTLVCRRDRVIPGGDHVVFIGAVLDCAARQGPPLLFLDSTYYPAISPMWRDSNSR